MVSVISGNRQLGLNRDCSLTLPPPRYKKRRVSAVRDFPYGCGPRAVQVNVAAKEDEGGSLKSVDLGENGDGPRDVGGKGFLRKVVESQPHDAAFSECSGKATSSLVKCKHMEHASNEFPRLPVDLKSNGVPDELTVKIPTSPNLTKKMEKSAFSDEIEETSKHSMEAHLASPPRQKVSAVCDFPSGCRHNVKPVEDKILGQDLADASTRKEVISDDDDDKRKVCCDADVAALDEVEGIISGHAEAEGEGQSDGDSSGVMITPVPQYMKSSEMMQEHVSEAKSNEQHEGLIEKTCYNGKDEKDVGCSANGSEKETAVCRKVERKGTSNVVSRSHIEPQEVRMPPLQNKEDRVNVLCLMAAPNCPWRQGREAVKSNLSPPNAKRSKRMKQDYDEREKCKLSADKNVVTTMNPLESSTAVEPCLIETDSVVSSTSRDEGNSSEDEEVSHDFLLVPRRRDFEVNPPFGAISSSEKGIRGKVRETLRLFHAIYRKLQQVEETKPKSTDNTDKRFDRHAAKILRQSGKCINCSKTSIRGSVPGIEVGDLFHFRAELAVVGLHRHLQSGIDYLNLGHNKIIATSIVASGGYENDVDSSDVLIYTGQGGNASGNKQPEDQKLERGNLALVNSVSEKNEVRVIRGFKEKKLADTIDSRPKTITTYTYDGLYTVEKYWEDTGSHGKLVYKFELRRIPGQPELAWKEVTRSKKCKVREGMCAEDISGGSEAVPICAINTVDDEKPPSFTYITSMMYPDWCQPIPPRGCDCKNGCSDSEPCVCAHKNGGEIPYNCDGEIVEVKPLVYECGPLCKCPPTCQNRVSQYGVKFPLEIFKTEKRGWGVRCLSSIPSGSFICEYLGELLDDKEAEQRSSSDEYLFDLGQNNNDHMPDGPANAGDAAENAGFAIDAAEYGNIGRFINHSCSPNLYAQNVLYDHEDKRIPHIMLFAADNIPPLQELSYDYNYAIDQVLDSAGNVRKKSCYCGSSECTGRMY